MVYGRSTKILSTICFLLITSSLILISNSPTTGFESSIYSNTPLLVWIFLAFSVLCGIVITISQLFYTDSKSKLWIMGLIIVILSYAVILSLPALRGYFLWCVPGDPGAHLSEISYIINTGHFYELNYYPILHVLTSQLFYFTEITPEVWSLYLPMVFSIFYFISIYLVAKIVLPKRGQIILATLAGILILNGMYLFFIPNLLAVDLFPFALYLTLLNFTRPSTGIKLAAIVFLIAYVQFHPIPALLLIVSLIGIWAVQHFPVFAKHFGQDSKGFKFSKTSVLFIIVIYTAWMSSFAVAWSSGITFFETFLGNETQLSSLSDTAGYAQLHGYNILEQFLKLYTGILLYILLSLIALVILRKKLSTGGGYARLFSLYGAYFIATASVVLLYLSKSCIDLNRMAPHILMFSSIFVGFTLFELNERASSSHRHKKVLVTLLTCALLFGVSLNVIFYVYPSPYIHQQNWQNTVTEIDGMRWTLNNKDRQVNMSGWYLAAYRYTFLLPPEQRWREDLDMYNTQQLPSHFGYDNHSTMGKSVEADKYVVITEQNKRLYIDVYPELASLRIQPEDFKRMESDTSLNKLYSNGGYDTWYLHSIPF